MSSIHAILLDIEKSEAFEKLDQLEGTFSLDSFSSEDRRLFARLLVLQGKKALFDGKETVLAIFNKARKISDNCPEILHEQGMIFLEKKENYNCLKLAYEAFSLAVQKKPSNIESWYAIAKIFVARARFEENPDFFHEADKAFEKIETLILQNVGFSNEMDFYWKWAFCLACLGDFSGEPYDFQKAIEKFSKALYLGCNDALFFRHYGHACADLGSLIDSPEYFKEALIFFERALSFLPEDYELHYDRACCIQCLADFDVDIDLLEKATLEFQKTVDLNETYFPAWMRLAQLETALGKIHHNTDLVKKSLKTYAKAYAIEQEHPPLLAAWADAELYLAGPTEDYEMILSAQKKILDCLKIEPNSVDAWYLTGIAFLEQARYFNDSSYCLKAIEAFQKGLSLGKKNTLFTFGIGQAYQVKGELDDDLISLRESLPYFEKVFESKELPPNQVLNDWGMTLLKVGELTENPKEVALAIEKFNILIESQESARDGKLKLEWLYTYGYALDLLGDLTEEIAYIEKAIEVLSKVVELNPEFYQARFAYAMTLWHFGEEAGDIKAFYSAIEHFEILIGIDPEDTAVHIDYGTALISLGLLTHDLHHPERSQELFQKSEHHLMQAASLGNLSAYYQLVCLYSINENHSLAFHFLEKADSFGALPSIKELLNDPWLEGLRQLPEFREFLNSLTNNKRKSKRKRLE